MRVIWGTRARGGSQFLLTLTVALLGRETQPQSRINAARREHLAIDRSPTLEECVEQGRLAGYFREHDIAAVKLEEPGMDRWGKKLAAAFPDTPWLGNHRPIEKIIRSHHNLKWGFSERKVLTRARKTLRFYEDMARQGRLFVLHIDRPQAFDLPAFAAFLRTDITAEARRIVSEWRPVNDLAHIRAAAGDPLEQVVEPPDLDTLRQRYAWVADLEARFESLCQCPPGKGPG